MHVSWKKRRTGTRAACNAYSRWQRAVILDQRGAGIRMLGCLQIGCSGGSGEARRRPPRSSRGTGEEGSALLTTRLRKKLRRGSEDARPPAWILCYLCFLLPHTRVVAFKSGWRDPGGADADEERWRSFTAAQTRAVLCFACLSSYNRTHATTPSSPRSDGC